MAGGGSSQVQHLSGRYLVTSAGLNKSTRLKSKPEVTNACILTLCISHLKYNLALPGKGHTALTTGMPRQIHDVRL